MLKILRKRGVAKKILWGITIVIIISFGWWGTGYLFNSSGPENTAGKVSGRSVSADEFKKMRERTRVQAVMRYGEKFREIQRFLNLDAETWDRIILLQEIKKRRIEIPDADVIKTIGEYPFFKRDGKFDNALYTTILRSIFQTREKDFEETVRDNLKFAKLFEQETAAIQISEDALREEYKKQNEKIQISYILVSPEDIKDQISVDDAQARQYYEEHKDEFLLPPLINVDYLSLEFPPQDPSKETAAPEASPQIPSKEEIKSAALKIAEDLKTAPDLSAAAGRHGLTVQTTGFFSMEQPNLSLGWSYDRLNEFFKMQPMGISDPFETARGWYIVQLKEKKESHTPPYEEAAEKAKDALRRQTARDMARQKAQEYSSRIEEAFTPEDDEFPEIVKTLGLEIQQTPLFNRGQYLPKIGISKDFQEAAFLLDEHNKLSDVVETEKGFCVLHHDAFAAVDEAQYEKDKEKFRETILTEDKNEAFVDYLSRLRLEAKLVDNVSKAQTAQE